MNRLSPCRLPLLALAAIALVVPAGAARAADVPFAGTWKLTVFEGPQSISLCVIKIEDKDGKPSASMVTVGLPSFKDATLENIKIDDKGVQFTLKNQGRDFVVHGHPAKGDAKAKRLFTTVSIFGNPLLALLDSTTDTTIDEKTAIKPDEGFLALNKAPRAGAAREKALKDILKKHENEPVAYHAAQALLTLKASSADATEADLKAAAAQVEKIGELYGPAMTRQTDIALATALAKSEKGIPLALTYIKKVEGQLGAGPQNAFTSLTLLTLRAGLKGAEAAELKTAAERYLKLAAPANPAAELSVHLNIARALLKAEKAAELVAEHVKKADELVEKAGPQAANYAVQVLDLLAGLKSADAPQLKTAAERYLKLSNPTGAEAEIRANIAVARILLKADKGVALALEFAKKAESLLDKDAPLSRTGPVLQLLATALRKAGKIEEAKALDAKIAKIDADLDEEFIKKNMPFAPEKFAGRKGKSQHVVLCELFTGAQCPPCVSADIAFDATLKTYRYTEVVFLQYHLHIPGPDALTNAQTEARAAQYGVNSTPSTFVDGKQTPGLGGGQAQAKARYDALRGLLEAELEKDAGAALKVTAQRSGDKIDIQADASDVKKPGESVRLRLVLVEEVARYPGSNGQRLHHHVVRAFPGGVEGVAVKEEKGTAKASINLAELRKTLGEYLDESGKRRPFRDDARPMAFKHLKVVALIQNDDTKEILQAAEVGVPEEK